MKASLALMRQLSGAELPETPAQVVERIGSRLGAVEEVKELTPIYREALLVKVVSAQPIAGSDHLSLCLIDEKGVFKEVARDQSGLVQVVCGAPNVRADAVAVWLPPGSIVPSSFGSEPFKLQAKKIMDYVSNGMLASARELAISADHEGIVLLDLASEYGIRLLDYLKLDDTVIDIENKMFTHRPDLFGQLGIAREISAIFKRPFKSPAWYSENSQLKPGSKTALSVTNRMLDNGCARFSAVALGNLKLAPSPLWLQSFLSRCGVRPINNIVDVTNFVMIATAQPLHAYDMDVAGNELVVRPAEPKEQLSLIDGSLVELNKDDIVIAGKDRALGLGGLMGGKDSEVSASTTSVILECANFDMYRIRRSMMAHGIFSEAALRFAKGQSPRQTMTVLSYAVSLLQEVCPGAEVISPVVDSGADKLSAPNEVSVPLDKLSGYLGQQLAEKEITALLTNAELDARIEGGQLKVLPPFWRTDINEGVDLIEEVARLYGYDELTKSLPSRLINAPEVSPHYEFKLSATRALAAAGANEALTYSFVDQKLLNDCGQDPKLAYKIANAISPGLQYYRLSLLPSLLTKVHPNHKAGYRRFALFESGKAHLAGLSDDEGLPREEERLALVVSAEAKKSKSDLDGPAYYQARRYLDYVIGALNIDESGLQFEPLDSLTDPALKQAARPLAQGRSAAVLLAGQVIGVIGEFSAPVHRALKLPEHCAGFELDLVSLREAAIKQPKNYRPLPKFPKLYQDLTLTADDDFQGLSARLHDRLRELAAKDISWELKPKDAYQAEPGAAVNWTFRLTAYGLDRTLTDQEISNLIADLLKR